MQFLQGIYAFVHIIWTVPESKLNVWIKLSKGEILKWMLNAFPTPVEFNKLR